ncbi:collagenase 3-like [Anneissia japonica]|uniref:collagenase 3-like n=1 Tax=Anneissia japonica TaxID=1529436 RepID=UPI0014259ACA|nr:collagenase 3-like [Anneissia japonica]
MLQYLLLSCLFALEVHSAPVSDAVGMDFLRKYKYLDSGDDSTTVSEDTLREAVKTFQLFNDINVSGTMDPQTLELMAKPRCGLPDPKINLTNGEAPMGLARGYTAAGKWTKTNLTYRIKNYTPDMTERAVDKLIKKAFKVWSRVTPLVFRKIDQGTADIMISFGTYKHDGDKWDFDGPHGTLAHAFIPYRGGKSAIEGDVHFDDSEFFTSKGTKGVSLFIVATHEIGHALGLEHSSDPTALMAPFYRYVEDFSLPQDDINGIQSIYGEKVKKAKPTLPSPTESSTPNAEGDEDPCNRAFDAVTVIRNQLFAFQGNRYWRWEDGKGPARALITYDTEKGDKTSNMFKYLPKKIDAVYESFVGFNIYFFAGDKYYQYHGNKYTTSGKIEDLIPGLPTDIDAATAIGDEGDVYFFKGSHVMIYNEFTKNLSQPILTADRFEGVPSQLSSVFYEDAGKGFVYFLKDLLYVKYSMPKNRIYGNKRFFNVDFLKCNEPLKTRPADASDPENGMFCVPLGDL